MLDIQVIKGLFTLLLMLIFIGICVWAFSKSRKAKFEELARLPLQEDGHE